MSGDPHFFMASAYTSKLPYSALIVLEALILEQNAQILKLPLKLSQLAYLGLSNIMSSGGMETIVQKMLGEAAHRFLGINPETGAIIGAIAGNIIFNMGGRGNSLTGIGKIILDNIISGKYKRDVHPFVPPVPTPGAATFGLNFHEEREKCLNNKVLFEDPEFPAADRSIYYKTPPDQHIEWKRPGQIVEDPQLIVGEKSRFDVKQVS
ncbi:hypothetical protein ANCDUO_24711 [Ancylostoma duodenale]|uniref:Calpain catalytic domain-containing protein n=1 Tax=Ancylostoma duodenale TaxID=51022 RepID=A0A0C2C6H9_9BILA|nr:hypothetical protein ANCDUO_24711 [Ancylostoma duodenale]